MESQTSLSKARGLQGLQEPGGLHALPGPLPPPGDLPELPASCPGAKTLIEPTGGGVFSCQVPEGLCFFTSKTHVSLHLAITAECKIELFYLFCFCLKFSSQLV